MLQVKKQTQAKQHDEEDAAKPSSRRLHSLSTLMPYVQRYKLMILAALVSLLISAFAMLSLPLGVRRMIDYGFSTNSSALIDNYFVMLIMIGAIVACFSALRFYCVSWLGERIVADLRTDVFAHLTTLSPEFYEKTHSGEVMSRLTADTTQIKAAVGSAASQALRNIVMLVGAVGMMILTSLDLSVLVILAIPIIVLPLVAYGRVVRQLSRKAQDTLAEASAYASENLSSIQTLQSFQHEKTAIGYFLKAVEQSFGAARSRIQSRAGLTAITIFLTFSSIVAILWVGAQSVVSGDMTGGELGQFVLYALFAAGAVGELSEVWGEVQQAAGAAERLAELVAIQPLIKDPKHSKTVKHPVSGQIEFDTVSFVYPSRQESYALKDISFVVSPGETLALVGPSGAGKTTLISLLLRFYDPTSGSICIDGVSVHDMKLKDLRKTMALVPQNTALFADTIEENIRYGTVDANLSQVKEAARIALAEEFIEALPKGFDTKLGEHGITLSGGQRQRIAIARAVLKNAPILLLDEATSALDAESETLVQLALERVMQDRTTLVIAHRLATVQKADRILVMDHGRIAEVGNHQSLIRQNGLYARLAKLQFSEAS